MERLGFYEAKYTALESFYGWVDQSSSYEVAAEQCNHELLLMLFSPIPNNRTAIQMKSFQTFLWFKSLFLCSVFLKRCTKRTLLPISLYHQKYVSPSHITPYILPHNHLLGRKF